MPSYLNPTLQHPTTLATTKVSDSKVDVCIIPSDQICWGSAGYLSKFLRHPWSFEAETTPGVWPFDCDHSRHCLPTSESSSSSSAPSSSSSSPACQNHQNQLLKTLEGQQLLNIPIQVMSIFLKEGTKCSQFFEYILNSCVNWIYWFISFNFVMAFDSFWGNISFAYI